MAAFQTLTVTTDGPIGQLLLNQPERLNPLSTQCLNELVEAAHWFDQQSQVRAVTISGAGRAFCAGADLATFESGPLPRASADAGRQMAEAIEQMSAVTVAAVHGHCVGGGLVLAAACDLRIAAASTQFSIPEVDLGIPLAWGGIPRLVREIGPAATRDLVLSCRRFGAAEARDLGLINRVVTDGDHEVEATALARALAAKAPLAVQATLAAVGAAAESLVSTASAWSDADALISALHDPDGRAARRAYLEARGR